MIVRRIKSGAVGTTNGTGNQNENMGSYLTSKSTTVSTKQRLPKPEDGISPNQEKRDYSPTIEMTRFNTTAMEMLTEDQIMGMTGDQIIELTE